jgi:hypothetical protein
MARCLCCNQEFFADDPEDYICDPCFEDDIEDDDLDEEDE